MSSIQLGILVSYSGYISNILVKWKVVLIYRNCRRDLLYIYITWLHWIIIYLPNAHHMVKFNIYCPLILYSSVFLVQLKQSTNNAWSLLNWFMNAINLYTVKYLWWRFNFLEKLHSIHGTDNICYCHEKVFFTRCKSLQKYCSDPFASHSQKRIHKYRLRYSYCPTSADCCIAILFKNIIPQKTETF